MSAHLSRVEEGTLLPRLANHRFLEAPAIGCDILQNFFRYFLYISCGFLRFYAFSINWRFLG